MGRTITTSLDVTLGCLILIGQATCFFIRPCGRDCNYVSTELRYTCTGISLTCIPKPCCVDRTRILDLSINNITTVGPLAFQSFPNLNTLDIKLNSIEVLSPLAFQGLRYLQTLDLRDNRLETLRAGVFEGLLNLRSLILSKNRINDIQPGTFRLLPNLKTLKLRHNLLQVIYPDAFAHVTGLVTLDLDSNTIHTIYYGSFTTLVNLQSLSLANNKIASLPGFLGTLTELEELQLRGNPLYCDCSLEFLRQWFRDQGEDSYRKSGVCSQPLRFTGQLLGSINTRLICGGYESNSYESISNYIDVTSVTDDNQPITDKNTIMTSPDDMTSSIEYAGSTYKYVDVNPTQVSSTYNSTEVVTSQIMKTSDRGDYSGKEKKTIESSVLSSPYDIVDTKSANPTNIPRVLTFDNVHTPDLSYPTSPNEDGHLVTSSTVTDTSSNKVTIEVQSQTTTAGIFRDNDVTPTHIARPLNDPLTHNSFQMFTQFQNKDGYIVELHPAITDMVFDNTSPSNQPSQDHNLPMIHSHGRHRPTEHRESGIITTHNQNGVESNLTPSSKHDTSNMNPVETPMLSNHSTMMVQDIIKTTPYIEPSYSESTFNDFVNTDSLDVFNESTPADEVRMVMLGEIVRLECPMSLIAPLLNYLSYLETKWLSPSGQWIEATSKLNRFTVSTDGALSIARVEGLDEGTYHCVKAQHMGDPSVTSVDLRVSCPCQQIPEMNYFTTSREPISDEETSTSTVFTSGRLFNKTGHPGFQTGEAVTCTRVPIAVAILITFQVTVALCTIAFCAFLSWRSSRRPGSNMDRAESVLERPRTVSEVNYYDGGEVPSRVSEVPTIVYESTGDDEIIEDKTENASESDSALSSSGSHKNSAVDSEYVNARPSPSRRDTETYADLDPQSRTRHDTYSSLHLQGPEDYE